jgi:hypothetical protein
MRQHRLDNFEAVLGVCFQLPGNPFGFMGTSKIVLSQTRKHCVGKCLQHLRILQMWNSLIEDALHQPVELTGRIPVFRLIRHPAQGPGEVRGQQSFGQITLQEPRVAARHPITRLLEA